MKQAIVENAREVCCSVRVGGKNSKSVWWNDEVKSAVRRKKADWKEVLAGSDEEAKERCMEAYREKKRKVKKCIYPTKRKVNELFGRTMNEDVNGNMILFWKEMCNEKGGEVESCSRIKAGNRRLAQGKDEVQRIWKVCFEDLKICILYIFSNMLQSTFVALMGLGEITTSDES